MHKSTVVLDSINRKFIYSYPYINSFTWSLTPNSTNSGNALSGRVFINYEPSNISRIKFYEFTIPYASSVPTTNNTMRCVFSQLQNKFYFGNSTNTVLNTFHVEFDACPNVNRIQLIPKNDDLSFQPAMQTIQDLTVQFYNPYNLYNFDLDYGFYDIEFGNPTTFSLSNATVAPLSPLADLNNIPSDLNSQIFTLNSGDSVCVLTQLTSPSAETNAIINSVNGYFIVKKSSTSFSIPVDTSRYAPYRQKNVLVYYNTHRFSILFDLFYVPVKKI